MSAYDAWKHDIIAELGHSAKVTVEQVPGGCVSIYHADGGLANYYSPDADRDQLIAFRDALLTILPLAPDEAAPPAAAPAPAPNEGEPPAAERIETEPDRFTIRTTALQLALEHADRWSSSEYILAMANQFAAYLTGKDA